MSDIPLQEKPEDQPPIVARQPKRAGLKAPAAPVTAPKEQEPAVTATKPVASSENNAALAALSANSSATTLIHISHQGPNAGQTGQNQEQNEPEKPPRKRNNKKETMKKKETKEKPATEKTQQEKPASQEPPPPSLLSKIGSCFKNNWRKWGRILAILAAIATILWIWWQWKNHNTVGSNLISKLFPASGASVNSNNPTADNAALAAEYDRLHAEQNRCEVEREKLAALTGQIASNNAAMLSKYHGNAPDMSHSDNRFSHFEMTGNTNCPVTINYGTMVIGSSNTSIGNKTVTRPYVVAPTPQYAPAPQQGPTGDWQGSRPQSYTPDPLPPQSSYGPPPAPVYVRPGIQPGYHFVVTQSEPEPDQCWQQSQPCYSQPQRSGFGVHFGAGVRFGRGH